MKVRTDKAKPAGTAAAAKAARRPRLVVLPRQNGEASIKEQAYHWLRREILEGRLPFGAVLSPRRLGEQAGISFLPVADALRLLEAEGLVESKDRVGTRVRIPTVEDIRGVYMVREALESQAARLCCECATPEQRQQLRELAREVDARYLAAREPGAAPSLTQEANRVHLDLHRLIAAAAHCPRLQDEIERSQVLTLKLQFDSALRRKERPRRWHQTLVSAVLGPDPLGADAAARRHIRYGVDEMINVVRQLQVSTRWRA